MRLLPFIILIFSTSVLIAGNPEPPIKVKEYELKNGLTVMLTENHDMPKIYGMVAVKAGGKNDPKDATGIAHYLEHMLFKGSETMGTIDFEKEKPLLDEITRLYEKLGQTKEEEERLKIQTDINEISKKAGEFAIANDLDGLLATIGATGVNAYTTEDYTAYHNTFPSSQLDKWLEIYSHRFEKPVFRLFQSELETVYEEKNRSMDDAFGQVFETLLENIYKNHPYGQQTVLGSVEHLKNPPMSKMYDYYNKYYVANNMVLILSGDFDTDSILPKIEEKFGDWRTGVVPTFPEYKEAPFNGREFVEKKMTPIKVGTMSFRAPKNGHPDQTKFNLAMEILSNYQMTGFLDKISDEGKIMGAGIIPLAFNDHGTSIIFYIPKIVGQKLENAEELVWEQINKLKAGEFEDDFFTAIKLNNQKELSLYWEKNGDRGYQMVQSFVQEKSWDEYYKQLNDLKSITKQDIVDVANKYFTSNYLCFYSKMGFPKKEKLSKPSFEPIIPKNEVKSAFAQQLETIQSVDLKPQFLDFNKTVITRKMDNNFTLNQVKNPFNEVFDLEIRYGVGKYKIPNLDLAARYLTFLGTKDKDVIKLKEAYHQFGASYYFTAEEESFTMHISGMEEHLNSILALTNEFINHVQVDEEKIKKLIGDLKTEEKMSRREPSYIGHHLNEFILLGDKATKQRELTKKELKKLTGSSLLASYKTALTYETTITFIGNKNTNEVEEMCKKHLWLNNQLAPKEAQLVFKRTIVPTTKIYFIDNKKAVQSQIYFNIEGDKRNNEEVTDAKAFNTYFGGGMHSLVFQEIREFRSLAYSAYGNYILAPEEGVNNHFQGYIGCQSDKTNDAIDAMLDLFNNMPVKSERIDIIRSSLIEKAKSSKPNFRYVMKNIDYWKRAGYNSDPNAIYLEQYKTKEFDAIVDFYQKEIKNKPIIITIVGDSKRFDLKKLESIGEVVELKEADIFVN